MEDTIVSFKVAKLAKENGFNLSTDESFTDKGQKCSFRYEHLHPNCEDTYPKPTKYFLQKWLREEHKIFINVLADCIKGGVTFVIEILTLNINGYFVLQYEEEGFHTYEEALEKALQKGLKLKKNIKNNK